MVLTRMTAREFDAVVEEAIGNIPGRFRRRLENVAFLVEKESSDPNLLGLYRGRPLTVRTSAEPLAMPDTITIFQRPHERMARDEEDLRKLVEETVWHEVAHYFGMDERQVLQAERRHEIERRRRMRAPRTRLR